MTAQLPIRSAADTAHQEAFRSGMRQLASGTMLITGGTAADPVGLVATAVCSVSVDPPTLLACINHSASAFDAIARRGRFSVNVLADTHRDLLARFTDPSRRAERFTGAEWLHRPDEPSIVADALATFDCLVVEQLRYHTHTVFFAHPLAIHWRDGDPLVHFNRGFHALAENTPH